MYFIVLWNVSSSTAYSPLERWLITGGLLDQILSYPTSSLTIREIVVNCVVLRREFSKEQFGEIRNPWVWILQTLRHLAQLTLDLDHPIQDQMGQNHKCVLLDDHASVGKALVQFATVVVEDAAETNCDISEGDNDVAAGVRVLGCLQ